MEKTIKWIYGNSLTLALPLKKVTVTSGGKIITDYYPPAGSEISVYLRGAKTFIYPYILEGNTVIIADDGGLIRGCYTVEIIVLEPEGLRLRFQWPEVLTVVDNTKETLPEFYNVPDYVEGITLDAGVFYFAKGDKGDTGPQGPKGDSIPGPQGPQGPQGPAGTTDYNELTNKPNLASVATSGSYNDLSDKPVIPDFSSKADKVQNPTAGNFASLDSNGNYVDSGHKHSDYLTSHQDLSNYVQKSETAGLIKNDGTIDTSTYLTSSTAHQVPSGGNSGQVLKKSSATDYDYAWANQTQDYPSAYCKTAAGTAGKSAACTFWTATANTYLHIVIVYANTSASALTLNVNNTSAAPLYINGVVSSSTNYTLPAGSYIAFYDGANWYINTDGTIPNVLHKSSTSGLVKNDGTIDTNTYLTSHQDISGKEDKVTIESASGATLTAAVDKYYTLSNVGTLAITLPTCTGTKIQSVVFYISTGSTPAVTFSSTHTILYSDGFEIAADSIYEVNALWNGTAWCLAMVKLEESV